jgi:hypothetical protein
MEDDKKQFETKYTTFITKNKKSENAVYNNVREEVVLMCLKYYGNNNFKPKDGAGKLFENFNSTLNDYQIKKINEYNHIGDRNNKDYHIKYLDMNNEIKEIDLEFKNGTLNIGELPQFIQLYTNNNETKILKQEYHKFYYDNYLDKILDYLKNKNEELEKPSYETYLKKLNDTKKDGFHKDLYKKYTKYKTGINNIVKKSIDDFLNTYAKPENINFDSFNKKLEQQKSKLYLLTNKGSFKLENISNYMKVISFKEIKNKNTIVFHTINNAEIHCLLRWKNGNGCRGPAWQIKFVKN